MPRRAKVDKDVRKSIIEARRLMQDAEKADANEAEVRRRIERIFESIMGFDVFKYLSRERAVKGAGETEHVDFTIQIEEGTEAKPYIMVEIKRINVDLAPKHLRQVSSYAIEAGCDWIILTNGKEWRLYHVSFGKPPITKHLHTWNLFTDDIPLLSDRFELISLKNLKKGVLEDLWEKSNVLLPRNMLAAILEENSIKLLRKELKKSTGVAVSLEDIIGGIRRLLNESALSVFEDIKLSLPQPTTKKRKRKKKLEISTTEIIPKESMQSIESFQKKDESSS